MAFLHSFYFWNGGGGAGGLSVMSGSLCRRRWRCWRGIPNATKESISSIRLGILSTHQRRTEADFQGDWVSCPYPGSCPSAASTSLHVLLNTWAWVIHDAWFVLIHNWLMYDNGPVWVMAPRLASSGFFNIAFGSLWSYGKIETVDLIVDVGMGTLDGGSGLVTVLSTLQCPSHSCRNLQEWDWNSQEWDTGKSSVHEIYVLNTQ